MSWGVVVLMVLQVAVLGLVIGLRRQEAPPSTGSTGAAASASWTAQQQLNYANLLLAKGLKTQGADALDRYVEVSGVGGSQRAQLAYQIGTLRMELGQYEQALAWFYQVEQADPTIHLSEETNRKIVECLERIGMTTQAQYEISSRTAVPSAPPAPLGAEAGAAGDVVVAKIGDDRVTKVDLDKAFDRLPESVRQQFSTPDGRRQFAREYVAREILYRKGQRLGYDLDPAFREEMHELVKQLVIERVVRDEMGRSVHVDPDDVRLYYEAHKDRYAIPAAVKLSVMRLSDRAMAEAAARRVAAGEAFAAVASEVSTHEPTRQQGGAIGGVVPRHGTISGVGDAPALWAVIDQVHAPGMTDPVEYDGAWWLVQVSDEVTPARTPPLEAIRSRVEAEYLWEKEQRAVQELLHKVLQEERVEFYDDRLPSSVTESLSATASTGAGGSSGESSKP